MTNVNMLSLWALTCSLSGFDTHAYRLNPKHPSQRNLGFEVNSGGVEFDGSLTKLVALANEKAKETAVTDTTAPIASAPSLMPVPATASPITAAPTTSTPTTSAPTTRAPESSAPTTASPVSTSPTTAAPAVKETSQTPSPVDPVEASESPSFRSFTVIDCEQPYDSVELIKYQYALEVEPGYSVKDVLRGLEADMNTYLASKLLPCAAADRRRRRMQEDIGLVALDSRPEDKNDTTVFCAPTFDINDCDVIAGQMRIFVATGKDHEYARYRTLVDIKEYLNSIRTIKGLYATSYISPEIQSPTEVNTGSAGDSGRVTVSDQNNSLSSQSFILFAFAGVAFFVSIGIAIWFRRSRTRHSSSDNFISGDSELSVKDPPPAIMNIDTMESGGSHEDDEPLSPFSKMLPAAYRLDDGQADMSVILESNESSSLNDRGSSILISEGYSTEEGESEEADSTVLNFSNYSSAPVLGAKPRGQIQQLVDL